MRRVIGQAAGRVWRHLHWLMRVGLLLGVMAAAGLGGLVWRLDQGPLAIPWLADEIVAVANQHIAPLRLEVGEATLVWEGFRGGVDRPLDIVAHGLVVFDGAGRRIAQVPEVRVSLSMRALATGRIAPRGLLVQGAQVRAVRRADGGLAVDFSGTQEGGAAEGGAAAGGVSANFGWLFEALGQPLGTDPGGRATLLSQLRRLQLRDTVLVVQDDALGLVWRAPRLELDVTRLAGGGAEGVAGLEVEVPVPNGNRRLAVTAKVALPPGGDALLVEAALARVVPADFAGLGANFAPLAAVRAPVELTATGELGPDLVLRRGGVRAELFAGELRIARGAVPVLGGVARVEAMGATTRLVLERLVLPGGAGRQTVLTGTATLQPLAGMLLGQLELSLDRVAFADLAALWPDGVGGSGAKPWITGNITAGTAHDLRLSLKVMAAADLSDGAVTALSGGFEGREMVVHWLRPVPPVEGASARLSFVSADEIEIAILGGNQGGLAMTGGRVTLTGLAQRDQYVNVAIEMAGPVVDVIGVLNHPRVNILSRRPVTMRNPSGRVEGRVMITALPLENDVTFNDVRLSSVGKLSGLNLGGIAAGRDLTNGALSFEAGNSGLQARGTATLAGIVSQVAVEMDFTDGPAAQVIQKVTVSGAPDAGQIAGLGLSSPELLVDGNAAVKLELVGRRSGRSELSVRADLGKMGLKAERLNWGKPAGRAAVAEMLLVLDRERFAGIERLRIDGEGVSVQAALDWPILDRSGRGARRVRLGKLGLAPGTDVQGEIVWPVAEGQPWQVRLNGPSLDISAEMARREGAAKPGEEIRGPAFNAELRVDRLVLGPRRVMTGVLARSDNDGLISRTARVTGRAGTGPFELSILPSGQVQRRSLTITAQDAGGLLTALDVMEDMRGGKLVLNGFYDDSRADNALSGTAEVTDFGMRNAPAIGKLLQAITVVGAIDAFSGPDLRFSRLVAPFRRAGDAIDLVDARAFSTSLGVTAKGRIDTGRQLFDIQGTVVPAYFINSLLGRVPLLGRLVSPETGGGLFAMSYGVKGPFDDPSVWVNPLSAVTPGFLRGLFGVFEGSPGGGGDAPRSAPPPPPAMREGGQR